MRIAVNTRFLLKNKLEGIGWYTYETLKRITQQHPEHEFLFFFDRPYEEAYVFAPNVTPIVLRPPARHPILFYIWFEYAVYNALKKHQADAFISTDGFLSLRTKVPTLLVIHDIAYQHFPAYVSWTHRKYYQYFTPKFVERADRIATVSAYSKQDIIKHFQVNPDKIDITYNGCRPDFKPLSIEEQAQIRQEYSDGELYFIYLGAIHPRKNTARLIQAFQQFKATTKLPNKLILVGRMAWQTKEIEHLLDNADYKNDIILLNYVDAQLIPKLLGAAQALVYPSLFEGFGIPILEAMNCNTPVITSNTSSMPEVAGAAALCINPYDVQAIGDAMQRIQETSVRQQLIQEAQSQKLKFSWQQSADKLYQALLKMLNA